MKDRKPLLQYGWVLLAGLTVVGTARADVQRSWYDPYFDKQWVLEPTGEELVVHFAEAAGSIERTRVAESIGLTESKTFADEYHTAVYALAPGADWQSAATTLVTNPLVLGVAPAVLDAEGFTKYYVPGQVLVQFDPALSDAGCRERIATSGSRVLEDYWTPGYYKITTPAGLDEFAAIRMWNGEPDLDFAEPVYMCYDDALHAPNDPFFSQQWFHDNPGTGAWLETADVQAEQAWDLEKGSRDVLVVIVDTGLDLAHEDLASQVIPRDGDDWDFSSASDVPNDTGDHGTACAGLAVAIQDNSIGVSGICPDCSLMPLKVNLSTGQNANRADAINYAASRRPDFDGLVISNSWRMSSGDMTGVQAAVQNAWNAGCVILASSGNGDGPVVNYPARYPEVIAVGATSPCDERKNTASCDGENWWGSDYGDDQEVMAPGVLMYTTDRTGGVGYTSGNYIPNFNGTSSACPLTAGIAALAWSANPELTNADIREILQVTADDEVGPPSEDTPGWDRYMGHGRVNALAAVEEALARAVLVSFEDDIETGGDAWTTNVATASWFDRWHVSSSRNHTVDGSRSWRCGATDASPYTGRINAALVSPRVSIQDGMTLRFWHYMDADASDETTALDGGLVEISTNQGETWTSITPVDGYTHTWGPSTLVPFLQGTPVFSGTFDWRLDIVDLSGYAGESAQVRFRFGTRQIIAPGEGGEGWYIDDVRIDLPGPASVPDLTVSTPLRLVGAEPNPFVSETTLAFQLERDENVRLSLLDVSGRLVLARDFGILQAGMHETRIADRDLPAGVYYARLSTANGASAERRIVRIR